MVIYNGVAVSQYNNADFMPETGDVTLINTDRDSYYDIALIMDYKNYFIASSLPFRISNKISFQALPR